MRVICFCRLLLDYNRPVICFCRLLLDYNRLPLGWILGDRVGGGVLKDYSLLYHHLHRDIRRDILVLNDGGLFDLLLWFLVCHRFLRLCLG